MDANTSVAGNDNKGGEPIAREKVLDKDTVRRLDSVTEDDIRKGYRLRDVPLEVTRAIEDERLVPPAHIRLSRVNPSRRRKINEEVQRRYHRDLRNDDILSNAQVMGHVKRRGEWDDAMQKQMDELQERTTRQMAALWGEGMMPEDNTWSQELLDLAEQFYTTIDASDKSAEERTLVREVFDKWLVWSPDKAAEYPEGYSPTEEQSKLFDTAPIKCIDVVNEIEELKDKQERRLKLVTERVELSGLQLRHAKIFADTAESRRDHTEEMAQLYYTCEQCDAAGLPIGPLTKTFDALWDFPEAAIRWMLYESFFFHQDIPDGARDYLAAFGFLRAEREPSENDPSDGSLAPLSSNLDGAPAEPTPADSGASSAGTTSTTASSPSPTGPPSTSL